MQLALNKTAQDSIALFMPKVNPNFLVPIVLSTGTGVERFLNFDPTQNVIVKQSINRNMYSYTTPTILTGTATFHPASNALTDLREILAYQATTGLTLKGTLTILNFQAMTFDKYTGFVWTSPFIGASRNRVMEDLDFSFACNPATEISLAFVTSLLGGLAGSGII